MQDSKNKTFVCRVNGKSIYWSNRQAKKDPYRFIIMKEGRQIYDTSDLYGAITHCLDEKNWTNEQRKKFIEYAKQFDKEDIKSFKK